MHYTRAGVRQVARVPVPRGIRRQPIKLELNAKVF